MKFDMKNILIPALAAAALLASCSEWTEAENKDYLPQIRQDDPAYLAAFDRLMANTSLVILDLKEIDPERHRQLTGKDNANILAMARHISDLGIPLWVRHVLVPGLTDDEEGLRKTADFIRSLKTVQRVEVLPYHTLGLFKWQKLGIPYPLPDAVPPTAEQVKRAEELLEVNRYPG